MDPYLESPKHWSDFHTRFIGALSEVISDHVPEHYYARLGEDVVMIQQELPGRQGREPDVLVGRDPSRSGTPTGSAVMGGLRIQPAHLGNIEFLDPHRENYIELLRMPDQEVVAVIELLSPTNKSGDGRGFYLEKRQQYLRQKVHIIEIDLIRAGKRLQFDGPLPLGDYYAFVSRGDRRPICDVYAWTVRDALPTIPIPLSPPDADTEVELGEAFKLAYQRGRYERMVRYKQASPPPSFSQSDAEWVAERVRDSVR
jgi:hypothetical protein